MKNQKQRNIRPTRKLLACALASCLMLGVAPAVFAQSTSATLRGQVSADSAPATDAKVTATNLATGLTRSVQANASGGYSLGGLPPGTYRIDVTAAGKTSSQNVVLSIGQTATLNLGVGGVAETAAGEATNLDTVTVTAPALLETKTSEVATYVTQKQIDALPQGSRNFLAFADIVPGMIFDTKSDGSTSLRSGAQNSNGINVFIDGVGQKNYVLKGGIGGQDWQPRQSVPAAGHRRIQGHHFQLQGRVRPDQQRRGNRGDQVGYKRVPWQLLLGPERHRAMAQGDTGRGARWRRQSAFGRNPVRRGVRWADHPGQPASSSRPTKPRSSPFRAPSAR